MRQLYQICKERVCQLYHKYKDRDNFFIILFVVLMLEKTFRHIIWLLHFGQGLPQTADSNWYITYAGALTQNLKDGLDINDVLYFGYNILLSLLLDIFGDPVAVVFIQAIIAGLSVILVYKIAHVLFNRTTAIIASFFYYNAWDITLWSLYILSDSFFVSLLLLCVYLLLMALESNKKKYKVLFLLASIYMLFFRPTGVVAMAVMLIYVALRLDRKIVADFFAKYRLAIVGGVLAVAALGVYFYSSGKGAPFITSLQYNLKMVLYNVYARGWIYDKPTVLNHFFNPDYTVDVCDSLVLSFIVNNWEHILVIYAKRAVAFLGVWVLEANFRSLIGIISIIVHLLPTALFLLGTAAAIKYGRFRRASILWLIILAVFVFCIFLFIDSMYRYRFPAIPFIAIVAAFGAERIIHGVSVKAKKTFGV